MSSESGRTIRAFLGIPYAEAPVGKNRFRAPQRVKPWRHILATQTDPPMCIQKDVFFGSNQVMGSEDCLFLNVYTPEKTNRTEKLPVLVYFHGGAWIVGTSSMHGPDYLLEHDVVLVTVNYRLGALGFLSTEDKNCPGNFAFKDQVLSLIWIQLNIDKFGGDPKSVTIFGESAGGASVNYHMMSPISKGLFHRAISQSGTLMNGWADTARPGLAKMRAIRLSNMMKCPITDTSFKEIIECLRKVPAEKLVNAISEFFVS